MASLSGFDASQVEPNDGFDVLPAGEYRVIITDSEMKATKAGTGTLINLTLQVLDGNYQNRKVFDRLNYENPNPTAQAIGRGTLSAICRAVGIITPKDTTELHNKPLRVKLKITNDPGYGEKNEVVKYSPDKAGPQQPTQQASTEPAGASAWAQTVGQ